MQFFKILKINEFKIVILLVFYVHLVLITFWVHCSMQTPWVMSFVLLYFMIPFHKTKLWLEMLPTSCGVSL